MIRTDCKDIKTIMIEKQKKTFDIVRDSVKISYLFLVR